MMESAFDERDASQAKNVLEFAKILFTAKSTTDNLLFRREIFAALESTGIIPYDILQVLHCASSAADVEKCLRELFKRVKRSS